MKILFKYATFKRPDWFKQTLEKYYEMLSGIIDCEFVITMNEDDETMNNDDMKMYLASKPNLSFHYGNYENKIQAINADMIGLDFDILFLISDDMIPVQEGFDLIIAKDMQNHFPGMDGALHYPDDCCNKDSNSAITLSIMGKKLYDRFGYIYHPDYKSFYCDNEFRDEVHNMKKVVFIPKVPVKHDWKGWGKDRDEVYKRNTLLGKNDKQIYEKRKTLGFPK